MRFRLGLVVGFGAGYYLGSMAGRERYEQINRMINKVKRSDAYDVATDKARAVVDLGVERARDIVESKIGDGDGNGNGAGNGVGSGVAAGDDGVANPYLRPSM